MRRVLICSLVSVAFIIFWSLAPEALAQPANDNCTSATVIPAAGPFPVTIVQDTVTATTALSDPQTCGFGQDSNSVWFRFTPSSSGTISADTIGSSYDTVLAIFTGVCGSLTAVACNDDSVGVQSRLSNVAVTAGVPILIEVTSFSLTPGGTLVLNFSFTIPTLFQGPAQGTSSAGAPRSTDSFASAPDYGPEDGVVREVPIGRIDLMKDPLDLLPPLAPPGSNEVDDLSKEGKGGPLSGEGVQPSAPLLLSGFQGITQTTSIPPDPIMAAGPNHLMGLVNSNFAIFTKSGTKLKEISATTWFQNVLPGLGAPPIGSAFDPKVVFDHHSNRWIMVWLASDFATQGWFLISASDDADPNGTWCNFALRSDRNGSSLVDNFGDYEGVGVDNQAIYLTTNQFSPSAFAYVKIRILNKAQLYNTACPAIAFTDFWDLRDPGNPSVTVFTTRPAVTFGAPGVEYLINDSPYVAGTFMTLWSLTNPLSATPTLTAVNVPVTASTSPPNADQLGGSSTLIDVGGRRVRNAVYRNGSIWTAHSVAGGTGNAFARARYVRIAVSGPTVLEDVSFGLDNCWLYYPAVTVDVNTNLVMVYNQSCTTTFAGIRYTGRTPADTGLQASAELKAGEANYVKTFGTGRNRWGDYSGIAVDPADPTKVWMFAEYAASPANTWGTFFGQVSFESVSHAPNDFDGDGKTDVAVWRPGTGTWFVLPSGAPGTFTSTQWGAPTDIPVPGDYDGDGVTDIAVWRPSTGVWFVLPSGAPGTFTSTQWGAPTDIPVPGDYDGDGQTDIAVWRPSTGVWFVRNVVAQQWGAPTDIPVPGDYDGDGVTDIAVWRPDTGVWYVLPSGAPGTFTSTQWGVPTDIPVPGDYDGDGVTDIAVWRPDTGVWFVRNVVAQQWGVSTDVPVPGDFDGDGKTDFAVWRPSTGVWFVLPSGAPGTFTQTQWGAPTDVPLSSLTPILQSEP